MQQWYLQSVIFCLKIATDDEILLPNQINTQKIPSYISLIHLQSFFQKFKQPTQHIQNYVLTNHNVFKSFLQKHSLFTKYLFRKSKPYNNASQQCISISNFFCICQMHKNKKSPSENSLSHCLCKQVLLHSRIIIFFLNRQKKNQ